MNKLVGLTNNLPDKAAGKLIYDMLEGVYDRLSCQLLSTGGLAIKAGSSAVVKAGTLCKALVGGKLVNITANTDWADLAGTVANATFNVYCFFIDSAGTKTTLMGTAGAAIGTVKFPPIPRGKTMIGFVIINPTGTGDFVGGTTALDDATVVPNAVYVNTVGAFDPTALPY